MTSGILTIHSNRNIILQYYHIRSYRNIYKVPVNIVANSATRVKVMTCIFVFLRMLGIAGKKLVVPFLVVQFGILEYYNS